jgi:hypothetical protein
VKNRKIKRKDKPYSLKYKLDMEAGDFCKHDIKDANKEGLTDALVVVSCLFPPDGSFSQLFHGFDGRSGKLEPLSDEVLFKVWVLMGKTLSGSKRDNVLSENDKKLLSFPYKLVFDEACKDCNDKNNQCSHNDTQLN